MQTMMMMMQRYQVSCTDNTRKLDLAHMINAFNLQIAALGAHVFYEFVPSKCNVADLPSWYEFELLEEHGGRRTAMLFPPVSDWMGPLDL